MIMKEPPISSIIFIALNVLLYLFLLNSSVSLLHSSLLLNQDSLFPILFFISELPPPIEVGGWLRGQGSFCYQITHAQGAVPSPNIPSTWLISLVFAIIILAFLYILQHSSPTYRSGRLLLQFLVKVRAWHTPNSHFLDFFLLQPLQSI